MRLAHASIVDSTADDPSCSPPRSHGVVASIPSPSISYFDIGPLRIHFYALCIIAGIIVAVLLTNHRLTKRGAEPWVVLDIALLGRRRSRSSARASTTCVTHPGFYFGEGTDIWAVFFIWEGGIAIYGALIGGAIGAWLGCRWTGIRFWTFADALAPGLLLAQAIGRFGNWFNQELFGLPTDLPWGLEIDPGNAAFPAGLPEGTLFHPTFLYEVIWNVARRLRAAVGRRALPPAVGSPVRPLPRLVQRRSHRVGVDPHRPERDLLRHPHERVGGDRRRRPRTRASSSSRSAVTRARAVPYMPGRELDPDGAAVQSQDTDEFVDVSEPPADESTAEQQATSSVATK